MPADPDRVAETHDSPTDAATDSVSRRRLLATTAAGTTTAVAGCSQLLGSDRDALQVAVWSGNYADRFEESVVPLYEDEFDREIQVHRVWDELLADLREAPDDDPPYDVTVTEGSFYYNGREEGLFHEIRTENVPNFDELIDFYTEFRPTDYAVPVDGAPCTIIYRDDLEIEPDSWDDFDDDAIAESNGIGVDTGFWWYPLHAAAIGMDDEDLAEEIYDEAYHDAVFDRLRDWNVSGWASSGEDIWQQFENGVIDVAQWYFEQAEYDIDDYENLSHTAPEQNTAYMNHWCVVEGTDRRDQAEEFIDFLLDAETQSEWSEHLAVMFANENTEYAGDLEEELPTTDEELQDVAFPDFEYITGDGYYGEFSDEFTAIETA